MSTTLTLGSLFDGSGGFPLAAKQVGIRPVWASEIEPFPILVTTRRLPEVTHLGDITCIAGGQITPVDIITFGSPCQDLSVAGKQAGLAGGRSNLFFEAIRIIKEMRQATNERCPRYAVWENVPGAFSSNQGTDFAAVLTALTRVKNPGAPDVSAPSQGWTKSGCLMADRYATAWRVLDAQHFGVTQRRRRIFMVTDFGGQSSPEILFEPPSSPRHSGPGREEKQNHAGLVETSPNPKMRLVYGLNSIHQSRRSGGSFGYEAAVSKTLDLRGGAPTCNQGGIIIIEPDGYPRRLTPLECARLQGFPDDWCDNLAIGDPSETELDYWINVWGQWNQLRGVKPKTMKQVRAWLASPVTDAALYKLWGNGIALPVAVHLLEKLETVAHQ